jgi:hypothetical protein
MGWGTGPLKAKSSERSLAAAVVSLASIAWNSLLAISIAVIRVLLLFGVSWFAGLHPIVGDYTSFLTIHLVSDLSDL